MSSRMRQFGVGLWYSFWDRALPFLPVRIALNCEFRLRHGRFPRLDHPVTFNEKVQHRKLFDRDPRLPGLIDKISAKRHVQEVLGREWTIPTLWHGTALPPRAERAWPVPYVLKASHGSGWNFFVRSPEDQDWDAMERTAARWLRTRYGRSTHEWAYSQVDPGLLVEPFLGEVTTYLTDYKVFVFGGVTGLIQVILGGYGAETRDLFDRQWNRQTFEHLYPASPGDIPAPKSLDKMIWAAERLGAGFSFIRVDFYELDEKPLVGELTFYPNAGHAHFRPENADEELGRLWLT